MANTDFDELVAQLERDHPEEMVEAREWAKQMLSTEEGRAAVLGMFVPVQAVLPS